MAKLIMSEYDQIRNILRDTYIYGCFTKYDFVDMGVDKDTFDKQKSKIVALLPENFIKEYHVSKKDVLFCKYNMFDTKENYFAETYRYCNYKADDLTVHFNRLAKLDKVDEFYLTDFEKELMTNTPIEDNQKIKRKLTELEEAGYIEKNIKDNRVVYRLRDNILDEFKDEELVSIYQMLDLCSNVSPFEAPYYFAKERVKKYIKLNREEIYEMIDKNNIFLCKHNHIFNLIDNDIMYRIMKAIKNNSILRIEHGEINNKVTENIIDETSTEVIPVKIIHECTYGRQYLIGYKVLEKEKDKNGKETGRFVIDKKIDTFRIDKIRELEILEDKSYKHKNVINRLSNTYKKILNRKHKFLSGKNKNYIKDKDKELQQMKSDINNLKIIEDDKGFIKVVEKYKELFVQDFKDDKKNSKKLIKYLEILEKIEEQSKVIDNTSKYSKVLEAMIIDKNKISEIKENKELINDLDNDIKTLSNLIKSIKNIEKKENEILICYKDIAYEEAKKEENCWTVSAINNKLGKVRIKFLFDEEKEAFILRRLENECREGHLERESKNVYIYETEVTSATEMIPWIRSFGERAIVVYSEERSFFDNSKIEERIAKSWNNILESYESGERDEILAKYNSYRK